jgi:2-hydroxymuconate-semialdehyde hydrolase
LSVNAVTDVTHRYIKASGVRTHYLEAGDGETLVLLHSGEFGASAELTWERNIKALAQHFRVIAPDWLGYGETDKLRDFGNSTSELMIRHIASFLDALDVTQADFAGCSMGGTMLLREAASGACRFPIRRMVLCSAGGFVPDNEYRRTMLDYDGTTEAMRRLVDATFHDESWSRDDEYVGRRVTASLQPGAWEWIAATRLKAPNIPTRSNFGQPDTVVYENVSVPTLVIAATHDKLREPGFYEPMRDRIPQVEVVVVDNAGHLLNIEKAEVFNTEVIEFLTADGTHS